VSVVAARLPQWQALLASKLPKLEPGSRVFPPNRSGQVGRDWPACSISAAARRCWARQVDDLASIYEQALHIVWLPRP